MSDLIRITGGCHCGAVRFEALTERAPEMLDCNCSICSASGYLHLFIPHDRFTLVSGKDHLTDYRFGSGQANHLFCKTCGVKSFYQPKSHRDCWSVHFNCIDDASDLRPSITPFDGRNWEKAAADKGLG
ncbi:MAG: GFA family protein [Pseudomonadota bacterium]